ncbi:MAG: tail fiber domain-containing protein [Steroidobacteraceae bacterium]
MNHSAKAYSVLICLISAMATPALAQQPPDLVTSDSLENTAVGTDALLNLSDDESGCHNTASGADALYSDTGGSYNTAIGFSSLFSNVAGNNNTAAGYESLYFNTASNNTANGYQALYMNNSGGSNTASGYQALYGNTSGVNNTAVGSQALYTNTTGRGNAALGANALYNNGIGVRNVAIGVNSLSNNGPGSYNIALGFEAGFNVTTGSNNIEIGTPGTASDTNSIQIGMQGTQVLTTIAGIYGTPVTGSAVYVTSTGQLGVLGSSERFKTDIAPMPELSDKLQQLRPVTFHYKGDPKGVQQYGLIAEEVDKVYPELVIRDDKGKIQGVRYEELAPMLLDELQKQQQKLAAQDAKIRGLEQYVAQVIDLEQRLDAVLEQLKSKDQLVAQR